jgi:hypothetical protein
LDRAAAVQQREREEERKAWVQHEKSKTQKLLEMLEAELGLQGGVLCEQKECEELEGIEAGSGLLPPSSPHHQQEQQSYRSKRGSEQQHQQQSCLSSRKSQQQQQMRNKQPEEVLASGAWGEAEVPEGKEDKGGQQIDFDTARQMGGMPATPFCKQQHGRLGEAGKSQDGAVKAVKHLCKAVQVERNAAERNQSAKALALGRSPAAKALQSNNQEARRHATDQAARGSCIKAAVKAKGTPTTAATVAPPAGAAAQSKSRRRPGRVAPADSSRQHSVAPKAVGAHARSSSVSSKVADWRASVVLQGDRGTGGAGGVRCSTSQSADDFGTLLQAAVARKQLVQAALEAADALRYVEEQQLMQLALDQSNHTHLQHHLHQHWDQEQQTEVEQQQQQHSDKEQPSALLEKQEDQQVQTYSQDIQQSSLGGEGSWGGAQSLEDSSRLVSVKASSGLEMLERYQQLHKLHAGPLPWRATAGAAGAGAASGAQGDTGGPRGYVKAAGGYVDGRDGAADMCWGDVAVDAASSASCSDPIEAAAAATAVTGYRGGRNSLGHEGVRPEEAYAAGAAAAGDGCSRVVDAGDFDAHRSRSIASLSSGLVCTKKHVAGLVLEIEHLLKQLHQHLPGTEEQMSAATADADADTDLDRAAGATADGVKANLALMGTPANDAPAAAISVAGPGGCGGGIKTGSGFAEGSIVQQQGAAAKSQQQQHQGNRQQKQLQQESGQLQRKKSLILVDEKEQETAGLERLKGEMHVIQGSHGQAQGQQQQQEQQWAQQQQVVEQEDQGGKQSNSFLGGSSGALKALEQDVGKLLQQVQDEGSFGQDMAQALDAYLSEGEQPMGGWGLSSKDQLRCSGETSAEIPVAAPGEYKQAQLLCRGGEMSARLGMPFNVVPNTKSLGSATDDAQALDGVTGIAMADTVTASTPAAPGKCSMGGVSPLPGSKATSGSAVGGSSTSSYPSPAAAAAAAVAAALSLLALSPPIVSTGIVAGAGGSYGLAAPTSSSNFSLQTKAAPTPAVAVRGDEGAASALPVLQHMSMDLKAVVTDPLGAAGTKAATEPRVFRRPKKRGPTLRLRSPSPQEVAVLKSSTRAQTHKFPARKAGGAFAAAGAAAVAQATGTENALIQDVLAAQHLDGADAESPARPPPSHGLSPSFRQRPNSTPRAKQRVNSGRAILAGDTGQNTSFGGPAATVTSASRATAVGDTSNTACDWVAAGSRHSSVEGTHPTTDAEQIMYWSDGKQLLSKPELNFHGQEQQLQQKALSSWKSEVPGERHVPGGDTKDLVQQQQLHAVLPVAAAQKVGPNLPLRGSELPTPAGLDGELHQGLGHGVGPWSAMVGVNDQTASGSQRRLLKQGSGVHASTESTAVCAQNALMGDGRGSMGQQLLQPLLGQGRLSAAGVVRHSSGGWSKENLRRLGVLGLAYSSNRKAAEQQIEDCWQQQLQEEVLWEEEEPGLAQNAGQEQQEQGCHITIPQERGNGQCLWQHHIEGQVSVARQGGSEDDTGHGGDNEQPSFLEEPRTSDYEELFQYMSQRELQGLLVDEQQPDLGEQELGGVQTTKHQEQEQQQVGVQLPHTIAHVEGAVEKWHYKQDVLPVLQQQREGMYEEQQQQHEEELEVHTLLQEDWREHGNPMGPDPHGCTQQDAGQLVGLEQKAVGRSKRDAGGDRKHTIGPVPDGATYELSAASSLDGLVAAAPQEGSSCGSLVEAALAGVRRSSLGSNGSKTVRWQDGLEALEQLAFEVVGENGL